MRRIPYLFVVIMLLSLLLCPTFYANNSKTIHVFMDIPYPESATFSFYSIGDKLTNNPSAENKATLSYYQAYTYTFSSLAQRHLIKIEAFGGKWLLEITNFDTLPTTLNGYIGLSKMIELGRCIQAPTSPNVLNYLKRQTPHFVGCLES